MSRSGAAYFDYMLKVQICEPCNLHIRCDTSLWSVYNPALSSELPQHDHVIN